MRRLGFWVTVMALTGALGAMSARAQAPAAPTVADLGPGPQEHPGAQGHSDRHVLRGDGPVCLLDGRRLHVLPFEGRGVQSRCVRGRHAAHPARAPDDRDDEHDQQDLLRRPDEGDLLHLSSSRLLAETAPRFTLQYGTPPEEPNMINFVEDPRADAGKVLDRYLEAIGGAGRLAKVTSFTGKGTYAGFDTGFKEVPVEVFGKAPNQRTTVVHMDYGENVRVYDGRNGWFAGPDAPVPLQPLTSGVLDAARLEALVAFPGGDQAGLQPVESRRHAHRRQGRDDRPGVEPELGTAAGELLLRQHDRPAGAHRPVERNAGRSKSDADRLRRLPRCGRRQDAAHLDGQPDLHADDDQAGLAAGQRPGGRGKVRETDSFGRPPVRARAGADADSQPRRSRR